MLHFTDEDWGRIERDYTAWWAGELDRPLAVLTSTDGGAPDLNRFLPNHPEASAEEICERFDAIFRRQHFYGDAFPFWFINFGAGVAAAFMGARLTPRPDTVWFEPPEAREMKDIHPQFDPDGPWWKRMVDVTRTAVDYWDGRLAVSHTDLGGNLDIVASLRGTEPLLMDLVDAPEEVERVLWKVSEIWRECYDRLDTIIRPRCRGTVPWARTWSRDRTYMLQCDFCYMISPPMFERFVRPELAEVCAFLDDAFYHLDGVGALPHLDRMLDIDALKGIQWIPGAGQPPPAEWPDVLRRIRQAGKLCQISCSPDEALAVTRELGGRGFQLLVGANFDADEAAAFLRDLDRANRTRA
jgi:hypothetical protein